MTTHDKQKAYFARQARTEPVKPGRFFIIASDTPEADKEKWRLLVWAGMDKEEAAVQLGITGRWEIG